MRVAQDFFGMKGPGHAFFEGVQGVRIYINAKVFHLVCDVFLVLGAGVGRLGIVVKEIVARQSHAPLVNVIEEMVAVHFVQ